MKRFNCANFKICGLGFLSLWFVTYSEAGSQSEKQKYYEIDSSVRFATSSLAVVKDVGITPTACERDPRFFNSDVVALKQVITADEANELFKFLAKSNIAFEVPESGDCQYRAHRMTKYLEDKGVYSQKVFLYGDFHVKNGFAVNSQMGWPFHVASMVSVSQNGKVTKMMMDPSIFTKPVPLNDWISAITNDSCKEIPITQDSAPAYKKPVPCEYQITERFLLSAPETYRHRSQNPPSNWDEKEIKRTNDTMSEDLPEALWRRDHHAGIEGTGDMAYRIVPSGTCVNTSTPDESDIRCRPADSK